MGLDRRFPKLRFSPKVIYKRRFTKRIPLDFTFYSSYLELLENQRFHTSFVCTMRESGKNNWKTSVHLTTAMVVASMIYSGVI
jgi:hypothetical protein